MGTNHEPNKNMKFPVHILANPFLNSSDKPICESLWSVPHPPAQLFVQGTKSALNLLEHLPSRGLAVIGTRKPQFRSRQIIHQVISNLNRSGLIIISGLAKGIDTLAHSAALQADLPTIAILGAGLDINYPVENQTLREQILTHQGLIISEFPMKTPALPHHFLKRNRLIAGWSHATWIVEAGLRSGALNTARWAREMNRVCFAVPCYPFDLSLEGNQTLLDRDHALPLWGTHSLGAVWMELATRRTQSNPMQLDWSFNKKQNSSPKLKTLINYVSTLTFQKGVVSFDEVSHWALAQGWKKEEFFQTLQTAVLNKYLVYHSGGIGLFIK